MNNSRKEDITPENSNDMISQMWKVMDESVQQKEVEVERNLDLDKKIQGILQAEIEVAKLKLRIEAEIKQKLVAELEKEMQTMLLEEIKLTEEKKQVQPTMQEQNAIQQIKESLSELEMHSSLQHSNEFDDMAAAMQAELNSSIAASEFASTAYLCAYDGTNTDNYVSPSRKDTSFEIDDESQDDFFASHSDTDKMIENNDVNDYGNAYSSDEEQMLEDVNLSTEELTNDEISIENLNKINQRNSHRNIITLEQLMIGFYVALEYHVVQQKNPSVRSVLEQVSLFLNKQISRQQIERIFKESFMFDPKDMLQLSLPEIRDLYESNKNKFPSYVMKAENVPLLSLQDIHHKRLDNIAATFEEFCQSIKMKPAKLTRYLDLFKIKFSDLHKADSLKWAGGIETCKLPNNGLNARNYNLAVKVLRLSIGKSTEVKETLASYFIYAMTHNSDKENKVNDYENRMHSMQVELGKLEVAESTSKYKAKNVRRAKTKKHASAESVVKRKHANSSSDETSQSDNDESQDCKRRRLNSQTSVTFFSSNPKESKKPVTSHRQTML